jgi:flagellar hook assembly protein FlgD
VTTTRFAVERAGGVAVTVHDVTGREVAVLARGEFPAGEFTRTWDGRDGQGRPVGSGTYFLRMEAAGYRASRKMVLIK